MEQNEGKKRHRSHAIGNETPRYKSEYSNAKSICQKRMEKKPAFDEPQEKASPNRARTTGAANGLAQRAKPSILVGCSMCCPNVK